MAGIGSTRIGDMRFSLPAANPTPGSVAPALRTERTIALIRITVLAIVIAVYLSSLGVGRVLGPAAVVVLDLSCIYAFLCLLVSASEEGVSVRLRVGTLLIDVGLITLWITATGGVGSEFWVLYLIAVVSAGLRFGFAETIAVAFGLAALHEAFLLGARRVEWQPLVYRPMIIIIFGFAVGALSYQRAAHHRERRAVERLAEARRRALGREREEVARLRQVDLARTELMAVATHELRTPLAAILGVLDTLRDHGGALADDVRSELIDGAEGQAERLSRMVEDLLTVSRIEDGVLRLSLVEIDPRDLVDDAIVAAGRQGQVMVEVGAVGSVVCDVDAMVRVLTNLIDNAGKFAPPTEMITVVVSRVGERVCFAVRDRGPGIPPDEREFVFGRFRQLDSESEQGAGLGLYIARGLVRAHEGELVAAGGPGEGAEFSFWLPSRDPGELDVDVGRSSGRDEADHLDGLDGIRPDVNQVTAPAGAQR